MRAKGRKGRITETTSPAAATADTTRKGRPRQSHHITSQRDSHPEHDTPGSQAVCRFGNLVRLAAFLVNISGHSSKKKEANSAILRRANFHTFIV